MRMRSGWAWVPIAVLVTGCVTTPTAPAVRVLPGSGKSLDQFQADDVACRQYAYNMIGGPEAANRANDQAWGNVAVGSALGAAVGAIIGSAGGQAGHGAAVGAGMGLLGGSAAGGNQSGYSQVALQHQYDSAYLQCMFTRGNQVPGRVAYRSTAPAPAYYPPPNYPPPGYPPPGYPPPNYAPQGYPPAGSSAPADGVPPGYYPPPNTPPPQ